MIFCVKNLRTSSTPMPRLYGFSMQPLHKEDIAASDDNTPLEKSDVLTKTGIALSKDDPGYVGYGCGGLESLEFKQLTAALHWFNNTSGSLWWF